MVGLFADNPIPACSFSPVLTLIGQFKQRLEVLGFCGKTRDTDAEGYREGRFALKWYRANTIQEPLSNGNCPGFICVRKQDDKFISPITKDQVTVSSSLSERGSGRLGR